MQERVLFARIGWMKYYRGPQVGDDRPIGGGSYNLKEIGHEAFNFQTLDGWCHGYFQPARPGWSIRLDRVDPKAGSVESLNKSTVIFYSQDPDGGGQVIVGWYCDAILYRSREDSVDRRRNKFAFFCKARAGNVCLLPTAHRRHAIPRGEDATGQSNVTYAYDNHGTRRQAKWIDGALRYVAHYEGPNLTRDDLAEASDQMLAALDVAGAVRSGQSFGGTPEQRKAVEMRAMQAAVDYYKKAGYRCDPSVYKTKPYDLLCVKRRDERYIEVKGTQGGPESVFLTRGEVSHVRKHRGQCDLFVLHGIRLRGRGEHVRALGGRPHVLHPWKLRESALEALAYEYHLPRH